MLCHPHPQYGGTMRSIVVSALFAALPAAGYGCLRFNFRGVEGSAGEHGGGDRRARRTCAAALDAADGHAVDGRAPRLVGWSFGADMALSVADPRVAAGSAIAPPLAVRSRRSTPWRTDPRPKHLVLAQHDEFRAPDERAVAKSRRGRTRRPRSCRARVTSSSAAPTAWSRRPSSSSLAVATVNRAHGRER